MRTALLTFATLSTLAPLHHAEACGSYIPETQIHQVSTHFTRGENGKLRMFVVLGGASDAPRAWQQLAPRTFDATRIASGTTLSRPMTFTLVGRDGTKVASGAQQVFLSQTFQFGEAASAVEVPALGKFAFAIEGLHTDATWSELEARDATAAHRQWVAARSATIADGVTVASVNGVDLLWAYDASTHGYVTFVKRGDQEVTRRAGRPVGVVQFDGVRRAVIAEGAWTSSVRI